MSPSRESHRESVVPWSAETPEEEAATVAATILTLKERGFRYIRAQIAVPGLATYGVAPGEPGFAHIELTVHLDADAPRERLQSLIDDALATAPIPNTIARPVPVTAGLAS